MNNAPTIVRLIRFPESLRLARKGREFIGPLRRSGPVVLSDRHDPIDVTFRVTAPGFSFLTGGDTITVTEAFNDGEQRDVLVPWQLVADGRQRVSAIVLEIDVAYAGTDDLHTATVPIELTYGMSSGQATAVVAGAALAAAAVAAVTVGRRKRKVVVDEEEVEVSAVRKTNRTSGTTKTNKKKAPAKKQAPAKKKAPAKKAGGTGRGSSASRSAKRTGARGSSKARKSPARRSTRKSR